MFKLQFDCDFHSVELDVLRLVAERELCLETLMGDKLEPEQPESGTEQSVPRPARPGTFAHTCQKQCLKCVRPC